MNAMQRLINVRLLLDIDFFDFPAVALLKVFECSALGIAVGAALS